MISIIVPVYNVEKYLERCIESIVNQTYKDIEIILVDDGSPDNCPAICDRYAEKDSRIKVIHKQNGGLINARKSGLEIAQGDYIGFVDSDDWIEPEMYEYFAQMINKYSPDMVLSDFYYDNNGQLTDSEQLFDKEYYNKNALEEFIYPKMLFSGTYYKFGINPCCWSKVFKKELIKKNLPLVDGRIKMGEDAAFTYPCLIDAKSAATVKKPCYHYNINPESMTKSYDEKLKDIIFLPYKRIKEKCCEAGIDLGKQLDYYLLYLANFLIRNEMFSKNPNNGIDALLTNQDVINASKSADLSVLPLHTKVFTTALRLKSKALLNLYLHLLKIAKM